MIQNYIENANFEDTGFYYTLSLISGKHKMVILYCLMEFQVVRFNELKRYLKNISDKTLSSNLKELEADRLIVRKEYPQIPPKVEYSLSREEGRYPVTFSTSGGTSIERTIYVVDQPYVRNERANEGVMAFNFFKTVDEITESQALDTDLKTWAGAQGWKLSNEDESVDLSVDYDFDPENMTEGVYQITFSTTGREFKIHTTDYTQEGQEVGLTFFPEDIHVMSREVF